MIFNIFLPALFQMDSYNRILKICTVVLLWYIGNTIVTISSKTVMIALNDDQLDSRSVSPSFLDLRWIELTMLQHLLGGLTALLLIIVIKKGSMEKIKSDSVLSIKELSLAALGNLIGNLATNAAYANITSSSLQMIKGCEPLVTFALTLVLYRKYEILTIEVLISIILICVGAGQFVVWDTSFNYCGLLAAIVSNIAFPLRNIFLKKARTIDSPLVQYTVISLYGSVILLPILVTKLLITGGFTLYKLDSALISSFFHFVYNYASITVLSMTSPLSHAILNLIKRIFVIAINLIYFMTPMTWKMILGALILFVGLFLFQYFHKIKKESIIFPVVKSIRKSNLGLILIVLALTIGLVAFYTIRSAHNLEKRNLEIVNDIDRFKHSNNRIMTMWLYNQKIPEKVLKNIESVHLSNPSKEFYTYCGTQHCIDKIKALQTMNDTTIEFLVISTIVESTPFETWFSHHPFNKILTGREFEDHLTEVVKLTLLSKKGGIYFDPTLILPKEESFSVCTDMWVLTASQSLVHQKRSIFDISCFANNSPLLKRVAEDFVIHYPNISKDNSKWPITYNFREVITDSYNAYCRKTNLCNEPKVISASILDKDLEIDEENHFATLTYDSRVIVTNHVNLGDEVQNFPGLQFLPFVESFIDREDQTVPAKGNTILFFNAWWGDPRTKFISENVDPIYVSMHIALYDQTKEIENLKRHEPIGARDISTLNGLEKNGIDTYLSACMTLMMKNPNKHLQRTDNIYIVDINNEYLSLIPEHIRSKAKQLKQGVDNDVILIHDRLLRFKRAYNLLLLYSRAKLVITQRIHTALPCVAMGIPVIFINTINMPGGGGTKGGESERISGLSTFFHTISFYNQAKDEFKYFFENFNYANPPPNPNINLVMKVRATFWNTIRRKQPLYDAARRFGLLPLTSNENTEGSQLVFHYVFTSARVKFIWKLLQNNHQWGYRRPIESILYHHPFAKVIIHSNTLLQSDFDVFTESGYSIEVRGYDILKMVKIPFIGKFLPIFSSPKIKNLASIENILMPLLVLYKWGGIFINRHTIIVKSIEQFAPNVISFEENSHVSLAMMKFEKKHAFLATSLKELAKTIKAKPGSTEYNGNDILTRAWNKWSIKNSNNKIDKTDLYVLQKKSKVESCFEENIEERLENIDSYTNSSIVYFKNSTLNLERHDSKVGKIKPKTLCKFIVNSFCVLCNEMY